mgnify:CR=1 FL=1
MSVIPASDPTRSACFRAVNKWKPHYVNGSHPIFENKCSPAQRRVVFEKFNSVRIFISHLWSTLESHTTYMLSFSLYLYTYYLTHSLKTIMHTYIALKLQIVSMPDGENARSELESCSVATLPYAKDLLHWMWLQISNLHMSLQVYLRTIASLVAWR